MNDNKIFLAKALKESAKFLSGRPEGEKAREKFNLDLLDCNDSTIEVIIDERVYGINPSFFLGLFGESYKKMGELQFTSKYIFICDKIIRKNIDEGIDRAKKEYNK